MRKATYIYDYSQFNESVVKGTLPFNDFCKFLEEADESIRKEFDNMCFVSRRNPESEFAWISTQVNFQTRIKMFDEEWKMGSSSKAPWNWLWNYFMEHKYFYVALTSDTVGAWSFFYVEYVLSGNKFIAKRYVANSKAVNSKDIGMTESLVDWLSLEQFIALKYLSDGITDKQKTEQLDIEIVQRLTDTIDKLPSLDLHKHRGSMIANHIGL